MDENYQKMNHILLYGSYEKVFKHLTDAQIGRLVKCMLHYLNTGEETALKGSERLLWLSIQDQIQRNMEKYKIRCEKNRNNIQKYWDSIKNVNTDTSGNES